MVMMMIEELRCQDLAGVNITDIKTAKLAVISDRCDSSWRKLQEQIKPQWLQRQLRDSSFRSLVFGTLSEGRGVDVYFSVSAIIFKGLHVS